MAKRPYNQANVGGVDRRQQSTSKRQKKDDFTPSKPRSLETFNSVRQIHGLFAEYSNTAKIHEGIQSLKRFLAECRDLQHCLHLYEEPKLCLLQEYLESQISRDGDETCGDLMQCWSFAAQSNNFQCLSSIPTAIHLLLRTISLFPTWRKHGVALAKTVLQPSYLKIVYRSLSGNKDAISSPCLRLLTEINKSDNGALCSTLHQAVDFTVKDLARNLDLKKAEKAEPGVEDPDRPSVRTVYVRFILSFFRYGPSNIKADIMGIRSFTTPLFKFIRQDTAILVEEIVTTFKTYIVDDQDVSRAAKTNYFNDWSLGKLAELCYRDDPIDPEIPDRTVADCVYGFLSTICTTPGNGICFKDNGWYGGVKAEGSQEVKGGKQIHNKILLGLIRSLRPYSNTYHLRLIIFIFEVTPELVAAYFNDNSSFSFDPKLTATWIGLSSVVLETIQIKVPSAFGYATETPTSPPPVKNMAQSIVPEQLTRTVLTKCLTYNNQLVRFFSIRIMNAIFQKVSDTLELLDELSLDLLDKSAWDSAGAELIEEVSKSLPEISAIITVFNQAPETSVLLREGVSQLLVYYHQYLPLVSSSHKFDFGASFSRVLSQIRLSTGFQTLEVRNCLHLARLLPETKWWSKSAGSTYSPAVTLMMAYVDGGRDGTGDKKDIYQLLLKIFDDSHLLETKTTVAAIDALLDSLATIKSFNGWERILDYLDNSCSRFIQSPYKFYDLVGEVLERSSGGDRLLSPLITVLIQQFKFVDIDKEGEGAKTLCAWLLAFVNNLWCIGEISLLDLPENQKGSSAPEVYTQFTQGHESWKTCMKQFGVGFAFDDNQILGLPLQFGSLPKISHLPSQQLEYSYMVPLKALLAVPQPPSPLLWRKLQLLVSGMIEVGSNRDDISDFEDSYRAAFGLYENTGNQLLASNEMTTEACLNTMIDSYGHPLHSLFMQHPHKLVLGRFDLVLLSILSRLELPGISDKSGIKHVILQRFAGALESLGDLSRYPGVMNSHIQTCSKLLFSKLLSFEDLKQICTEVHSSGLQLPPYIWRTILQTLGKRDESIDVQSAWIFLAQSGVDTKINHQWLPFLREFHRRLHGHEATSHSKDIIDSQFNAKILIGIVEDASQKQFSDALRLLITTYKTADADVVGSLIEAASSYLTSSEKSKNEEEMKQEFVRIVLPLSTAISTSILSRDEDSGRLVDKSIGFGTWKNDFISLAYKGRLLGESTPSFKVILGSGLIDNTTPLEYFEIGLDLGEIKWDEALLQLFEKRIGQMDQLIHPESFRFFEAAYRASQGTDMGWFSERVQKLVYGLTVQLSASSFQDTTLEFCKWFGVFLQRAELDLLDYTTRDAVNSLLEASLAKLESLEVVELVAAVVGTTDDIKSLQHSKFLQTILSSTNSLSLRTQTSTPSDECYLLAFIIRRLFSTAKASHSNITTLGGILTMYRGTSNGVDTLLLEIFMAIEATTGQSIMEQVAEMSFSDDLSRQLLERNGKGRFILRISPKVLSQTLQHFCPKTAGFTSTEKDDLKAFRKRAKEMMEDNADERSSSYDVGFMSALVMHSIASSMNPDGDGDRLDIKDVVENGILSLIIMGLASENGEERGMSEAVLIAIVTKLETSSYRERVELIHLLCAIITSLPARRSGGDEQEGSDNEEYDERSFANRPIPTVTALFFAQSVGIVTNPGHFLYEKIMTLLQARPGVYLNEVPLLKSLLYSETETYWKELAWVLGVIADGLRSERDLEVCRRGVFENLMSIFTTSSSGSDAASRKKGGNKLSKEESVRRKILEVLWNAAGVEGGATTLITRTGILSWIRIMICRPDIAANGEGERVNLKRLAARLWEACDKEYVKTWSGGSIGDVLENLVKMGPTA